MYELCRIGISLVTVVALAAGAVTAQGQEPELASAMSHVLLFDAGAALAGQLPSAALADKVGWVRVEEDAAPGQFSSCFFASKKARNRTLVRASARTPSATWSGESLKPWNESTFASRRRELEVPWNGMDGR